ncbi:MAG: glycosyltransferase family 4 protein [Coriobacteriia bacterium]|nr:glycosyltransferase family 4 protein [Coriobacteriia bacterium]
MRILYIYQFFATPESSLGLTRSYEFARALTDAGHEVTVLTSASNLPDEYRSHFVSRGEIDGIKVRAVRVGYSNYMGHLRRILSFAAFMLSSVWVALWVPRPDVVFASSTPITVALPGLAVSKVKAVPFVFEVQDLWPEAAIQMGAIRRHGLIATVAKRLERAAYRRAVAVVPVSPGMAEGVVAEGTPPCKIEMIPNFSDLERFHPGRKDSAVSKRYGLAGKFVVGYTGAIGPSNAVHEQVPEAARTLKERGRSDIVFAIAGDGKSLPELQRLTEGLENVLLLGRIPKTEVPALTRTADVLMTLFGDKPILATNSPNKFFDALASGRPVIVNQPGWTRELVEDHGAGLYVPVGDGVALADAIESLADDKKRTKAMGLAARALAEEAFGRDLQAARIVELLERVAYSAE